MACFLLRNTRYLRPSIKCMRLLLTILLTGVTTANAQDTTQHSALSLHFQTTYIYQYKPPFHSPYESTNSLTGAGEHQNSLTATLFSGLRLWKGAAIFVNPELAGGSALSGAYGMGGSTNGETFRVGNPAPTLYLARAYFTYEIPLNTKTIYRESDANIVPGSYTSDYIRFYIGKYSLGDLFDNNQISNSPRTQFLNWSLMNTGAWDYAADVRGYTYSVTTEVQRHNTNYKLSIASLPKTANGSELNTDFTESYAINASITQSMSIFGHSSTIGFVGFRNCAAMGNYKDAVQMAVDTPDIIATRKAYRSKYGFTVNGDMEITKQMSAFLRAGWNDGKNETWAFTEIDNTIALGVTFNGQYWRRLNDVLGIAVVSNGLSKSHEKYLEDGGYGFVLGDGKLDYQRETITEVYYHLKPSDLPLWFTADYQLALNPGYNHNRGPVNVFSFRVHVAI